MAHIHILGGSGTGKSTFTRQLMLDAVHRGEGLAYFDPHGHDTNSFIDHIPKKRRPDVILFDPSRFSIPNNPLITSNIHKTAQSLTTAIATVWGYSDVPTPRMDGVLYNSLIALIEAKEGLFGLYLILVSDGYRKHVLEATTNPVVRSFWSWYETLAEKDQFQVIESTLNKVQILMADPRMLAISGKRDRLSLTTAVNGKILLFRLPQGELGIEKTALIGSLLLVQLHEALLSRDTAVPFHVVIDEAHTFAPEPIAEMLSGIRKQNVSLIVAHQYLSQLSPGLRASLKANAMPHLFRLSFEDSGAYPELGNVLKPHELMDFQYWRLGRRPAIFYTYPVDYPTFKTARRDIETNMRVNYHLPATAENENLLRKYG